MPSVPDIAHPDDVDFIYRENRAFYSDFWSCAAPHSRWVHDLPALIYGENKVRQLAIARECGFRVPTTLISNDPSMILDFLESATSDGLEVVYKTFSSISWRYDNEISVKHTALVSSDDIRNKGNLSVTPGIYQRRIEKAVEIRVNFFGPYQVAVSIDACRTDKGTVDWRSVFDLSGHVQEVNLPYEVIAKCREVMNMMGLVMACFDLIVDVNGDYYFIELNQQGQFLWCEEMVPKLNILDVFVRFLLGIGPDDVGNDPKVKLKDILDGEGYRDLSVAFENSEFVHA